MKNKKFKLTFLGAALCFALIGCSNDDSVDGTNNNNSESGVVTNGEITLTYGSSLLNHNVQNLNERLNIQGMNGASARSTSSIENYSDFIDGLNLGVATDLSSTHSTNIDQAGVYRIPANVIFTGNFNVNNSNVTLIVEGEISGSIILNNTNVIVSPTGKVNVGSNLRFNSGSKLHNWGVVNFIDATTNGSINNNNLIIFKNDITFNSSAPVKNNCKMIFEKKANFDAILTNNSFVKFEDGFKINGSGKFILSLGSYTKVTDGTISYDGTINGVNPQMVTQNPPRLDFATSVNLGTINGSNRIADKIDINTTFNASQLKASATVLFNQNTFVPVSDCTEGAGTSITACSIVELDQQARYVGHAISPIVEGITLSATDVKVVGNKAYVSYHTNDEIFGGFPYGSIRVFDINSGSVSLVSEANFNNCEFNALTVENDKVYSVGNNLDGGRMFSTPLGADKNIATNLSAVWSAKTPSLGGKSIAFNSNTLWLVGGPTGGLYGYSLVDDNYDFSSPATTHIDKSGGKYVAFKNNKQVFFAINNAGNPYLRIVNTDGSSATEVTDTSITLTNRDGKNAISVDDNYIYVALSEQGVAKYSLTDGSLVARFVPSTVRNASGSRIFPNNGLSNAVTIDNCFVYVANGADGVIILDKNTFKHVGHFKTGLQHSTNFVYAKDNYLYVANGRDGLRVIQLR